VALVLSASLAGCSFSHSSEPTNVGPFSDLVRDIKGAGITLIEASETGDGGLYLKVSTPEGQDASAVADELLSLAQKYKEQLNLRWLRVLVVSTGGSYDHTFDLEAGSSSTG
jgi:hypothetical protein